MLNNENHIRKGLAIIGSTGSIGQQALDVVFSKPEYFSLKILTAAHNV